METEVEETGERWDGCRRMEWKQAQMRQRGCGKPAELEF